MSATVYEIFDQIKQLPSSDRSLLDRLLDELAESEWQAEARKGRQVAQERDLDQDAIDRAIQDERS